jgi:hypothetical protein
MGEIHSSEKVNSLFISKHIVQIILRQEEIGRNRLRDRANKREKLVHFLSPSSGAYRVRVRPSRGLLNFNLSVIVLLLNEVKENFIDPTGINVTTVTAPARPINGSLIFLLKSVFKFGSSDRGPSRSKIGPIKTGILRNLVATEFTISRVTNFVHSFLLPEYLIGVLNDCQGVL